MMPQSSRVFTRQGPPPPSTPAQLAELEARLTGGKAPPPPPGAAIADSLPEDNNPILTSALAASQAGLSVVPPMPGQKRPLGHWKQYQQATASEAEIREWYATGNSGLGLVTGGISGNLEALDFDSKQAWSDFKAAATATGLGDLLAKVARGYAEETPNGFHLLFRCTEVEGNTKLAQTDGKTLIETRGDGGYIIIAPSVINGHAYTLKAGGFDSIVTISPQERDLLHRLARSFDQPRKPSNGRAFSPEQQGSSDRVGELFNQATTWPEILAPHGWQPVYQAGETTHWRRPGKSEGTSATTNHADSDLLWVFSANAHPLEPERSYDRFGCWAMLEHNGDFKAATKAAAARLGIAPPANFARNARNEGDPGHFSQFSQFSQPLQPGEWHEPEPLRAPLADAEAYPLEALGNLLAPATQAMHQTIKAPLPLCAQSVLAAASFATQAHYDVATPWGETKPSTLFFLTVGESGERKSGADEATLAAARAQERADMEAYRAAAEQYETEAAAWRSAQDQAKKAAAKAGGGADDFKRAAEGVGPAPQPPILPLRFVSDPTTEGLFKLLAQGQPSVALFSDEGGLLIGGHALNSENALKTLARWCKLWDGAPFDRVRAGDGSAILYGRRMALHQLAQPEVMATLLNDGMANGQGFLARCLVAWPESTIGTRHAEQFAKASDRPELKRLFATLKALFEATPATGDEKGQELTPYALQLTPDAERLALAAHNEFETLMAKDGPLVEIRDRAAKALDNALRLAAVLAVMDHQLAARVIEAQHLERGLILAQWYLAEALRIRGAAAVPQATRDAESLLAWIKERGLRRFRSDPVLRKGPNATRNKDRLQAAVALLIETGWIRELPPGTEVDGARPRKAWEVNPHVF